MKKNWEALVLDRALELLRKGWTQDAYARDGEGRKVEVYNRDAKSFSARGAILRAEFELDVPKEMLGKTERLVYSVLGVDLQRFNNVPIRLIDGKLEKVLEKARAKA